MLFVAIIGYGVLVGRALSYLGILAFEMFEGIRNIISHGKVNAAGVTIPIKGESEVKLAFPVLCNVIFFFDAFDGMVSMLITNILYSKIFHDEREVDRPPFMCPQTGCNLALVIAMGIEECFNKFWARIPLWGSSHISRLMAT